MRFLRRGGSGASDDGDLDARLAAFWRWWASAKDDLAAAIERAELEAWVEPISKAVHGVQQGLAWELGTGLVSKHQLVITAEGNAERRPFALRWAASAPPPDETWEFHASRQPSGPAVLRIGGATVDLSEVRAVTSWDETRERLSVRLWHPAMEPLPEEARGQIAFLFLDNLIGEDEVERWLGQLAMDPSAQAGRTADELRAEFERRAAGATRDQWAILQGTDAKGRDVIVRLNASLKRIDQPFADQHLAVTVERGLDHAGDHALNEAIAAAEDELETVMAGVAIEVAHVTDARRRITHYVCEDGGPALAAAKAWAARYRQWGTSAELRRDPHWEFRHSYGE